MLHIVIDGKKENQNKLKKPKGEFQLPCVLTRVNRREFYREIFA